MTVYQAFPLDRLVEIANAQYEEEQRMQAQNWKDLHTHFAGLVNIGAKDFRQAAHLFSHWGIWFCVHTWNDYADGRKGQE